GRGTFAAQRFEGRSVDFLGRRKWHFGEEEDAPRVHIWGTIIEEEPPHVLLTKSTRCSFDNKCDRHLALDNIRHGNDGDIDDAGVLHEHVLYLLGVDALAGAVDAVIDAPNNLDVPLLVGADDVTSSKPAIGDQTL